MVLKKYISIIFMCLFASICVASENGFYPLDEATKKAKKILKNKDISLLGIPSNFEGLPEEMDGKKIAIYKIDNPSLSNASYILFSSTKGRFEYFDYAVTITKEHKVNDVRIVKYLSEHGTEVSSKKWLSQFIGYAGEKLEYGKDIQAISGATKSASSLTNDIPLVLSIFNNSVK